MFDKFIENGKVGNVDYPTVWEWLGEHIAKGVIDAFVDSLPGIVTAFPILAVVSGGVYALLNMLNKRLAKFGAFCTVVYGVIVVLTA